MSRASTTETLRAKIRDAGLRATAPRVAVLQRLERASTPRSHAELVTELSSDGWDRATIYRNLSDLAGADLVRRTDLGDHVWRFEIRRDENASDRAAHATREGHPHFVCDACGSVACLPVDSVEIRAHGREVPQALRRRRVEIQLRGRCDRCD